MRFTSLIIELIRARPRLVVWLVVLFQAALWLILPLVLYRCPPGDLATVLAYGREYQVGTDLGPPLASARGRRALMSFDALFALLVIAVLALPYLIWLIRADTLAMPPLPAVADLSARAVHWGVLLGFLAVAMSGIVLLVILNSGRFTRNPEEAPIIFRPPVDPLTRHFVYFFALAPAFAGSLISALFNLDGVVGGSGIALLMSGLAGNLKAGDLVHLRRQRLLPPVLAAVVVAPAPATIAPTPLL